MKKAGFFTVSALSVLLAIGLIASCGRTSETTTENIGEVSKYATENVQTQGKDATKQLEAQLSQYNKSIAELKAKAPGLEGQARDELNKQIEMIEKQTGELDKQIKEMDKTVQDLKTLPNTVLEKTLAYLGLDGIYKNILSIIKTLNQG